LERHKFWDGTYFTHIPTSSRKQLANVTNISYIIVLYFKKYFNRIL